jgi:K+/H+ antiporter YhaU regulatory subunit KhtT
MITFYSILFHFLMILENREFGWITGFYWTLTVMSTLGFGDITFTTDLGKLFSILVLASGIVFLLTTTTHDDPSNIYLTIYCRRLRPDIQIISRANLERSISKLHTAGADLVMSYASMAASTLLNLLKPDELLMLAEGLDIFRIAVHPALVGKTLAESQIRKQTGCNIIAVYNQEKMVLNPYPSFRFEKNHELILIGTGEAEGQFFRMQSEMDEGD